ncbi:PLD nuclease N-terminal domain-containing protein [Demequina mangrovi]|uniref:Phospholipase_D-nuclease N-terminal n=1 Tax=Demequina mangrovi TaxID=1043493 RepID=A0A1H6W920_9MICO|nr:PLD nuclease N-terminal domain-containing protein [Demequina mangrovi]SEJ13488.1 Phospholipase_D-nuclease N-terminal [Demequina mangrovi]
MLKVLPLLAYIGLVIYALSDLWQRPDREPYGVSRGLWTAMIIFLPFIGALAWIVVSMLRPDNGTDRRSGPVAPDDDPEYLAWLREQTRRKRKSG